MERWNLVIDVARCENCNNCVLATKDEHVDNSFPGYGLPQPRHGHEWIRIARRVRGEAPMVDVAYLVTTCNHCDNAPCVTAGKGAVRKREDGIVLIDPEKAHGREDLVRSCPYGAIWWNDERQIPQKWSFDAHLLDQGWKEPRCTQACPTGAMRAVKLDDERMRELVAHEGLETLQPELGTQPRVYYANLHRYTNCFVGGTVVAEIEGRLECVEGAWVELFRDMRSHMQTTTDSFGDFKFERLDPKSGSYRVEISHSQWGSSDFQVQIEQSRHLGTVRLSGAGKVPA